MDLAGSPGPHVFVSSIDDLALEADDEHHIRNVLRLRDGDPLTASDGQGRWRLAELGSGTELVATGDIVTVDAPERERSVGFSLVKGQKPELVVQKLTELGIDRIVALRAERSVVKWDDDKIEHQRRRWARIAREAAMQSHRIRLPRIELIVPAREWIANPDVSIAHFDGDPISGHHSAIAVGPEGGWSPDELAAAGPRRVNLGPTVLRSETAAIAAATLLCATDV